MTVSIDLAAIREREDKAFKELIRILSIDEQPRMSIPANAARDTDLIISASLGDIPALLTHVSALQSRLDEAEKQRVKDLKEISYRLQDIHMLPIEKQVEFAHQYIEDTLHDIAAYSPADTEGNKA